MLLLHDVSAVADSRAGRNTLRAAGCTSRSLAVRQRKLHKELPYEDLAPCHKLTFTASQERLGKADPPRDGVPPPVTTTAASC